MAVGADGGEADATVATDHGGYTVPTGWGEPRIPRDLTVVVRMNVDKARCDQLPLGIDFSKSGINRSGFTNFANDRTRNGDVGNSSRSPAPINEKGVANNDVKHGLSVSPDSPPQKTEENWA
ncbi:unannotated protein [freshwater metagenome]|uniref:Unannotated protein n=1 Tax=freshwater metagenome TaxID=449393 RepID=A0A6J6WLF8_9ZZZZ